uniref:Ubiquitin carboxyl-terminal hydrolase 48 n=1 Tax=Melanaphis sacchari TaxID=742174 RepID=A0A2H8TGV1_9HEMI
MRYLSIKAPVLIVVIMLLRSKMKLQKKWYQFNDDQVDKLTIKGFNLYTDEELKKSKSMKNIKNHNGEFQSTDAYMLVYMKDIKAEILKTKSIPRKLLPRLTQLVNTCDNNFENKILDCERGKVFVEQMLNLINEIKSSCIKGDGDIISLQWLKYLFKVNPNEHVKAIDNNTILCKHNLLDPEKIYEVKYIGSDLADKLYDTFQGGPRLKLKSSLCLVCVRNKCALTYTKTLTNKQHESITKILKNWSETNDTNSENTETSYWVGNETIKCWQRKYFESFQSFLISSDIPLNTKLPINHEILSAVCEPSSNLCKEIIVNGGMKQENMTYDAEDIIKLKCYNKACEKSNTEVECKDNLLLITNYEKAYFMNNSYMPWKFNDDIICEHGNLTIEKYSKTLVPKEVMDIFQTYFPNASLFVKTTTSCRVCRNEHIRALLCKYTRLTLAKLENYFLRDLLWNKNISVFSRESSPYACISAKFLETFRKFVKAPLDVHIPNFIKNKELLCDDHNKLIYHPGLSLNPTKHEHNKLEIITKKEWKWLLQCYEADFGIFVYFDAQRKFKTSNPEICETCRQKKLLENNMNKLKYNNVQIFIEVEDIEDQNGNCSKKFKQDTTVCENNTGYFNIASTSTANNNMVSPNELRRSERKQIPKVEPVIVSFDNTVFDLKLKIMEVFKVYPTHQYLKTAEGIELVKNDITLGELNILPFSVILAQFHEEKVHKSEVITPQETGFKGTELMH